MNPIFTKLAAATTLALAAALPAQATISIFKATLNGANESPANASLGVGTGTVTFDTVAHTMRVQATFSDLSGNTTVAHIHGPTSTAGTGTAGVMTTTPTFAGFPAGVTSATYDATFDTSLNTTYRQGFITANGGNAAGAEAALYSSLLAGTAYLNIHSSVYPGGEIRGFLLPVPEASTYAMMLAGLVGVGAVARRRRLQS